VAPTLRAQLQIHFCVFLWGFTAILGKLISLAALPLVWWRMLLVAGTLALMPRIWRHLAAMSGRLRWAYAGIGALVALHWVTFYASIKLSNASVAATCMAMGSVFVSMIEPILAKRAFQRRELLLGVAVIPGVMLVVGGVPSGMHLGIAIGVFSAFIVAIFSALNKRLVEHGNPLAVTALEMAAGAATVGLLSVLRRSDCCHPCCCGCFRCRKAAAGGRTCVMAAICCCWLTPALCCPSPCPWSRCAT